MARDPGAEAAAAAAGIRAGSTRAWAIATRPRTLWIAVVPVLVANGFAWRYGAFEAWVAVVSLVVAVLMQVITNLQNDVGYTERGGEHVHKVGPRTGLPRATALDLLSVAQVRRAIVVAVLAAAVLGLPVVNHAGWPLALVGLGSIAAALAYMGGPRPIAYGPYGELVVLAAFGWAGVGGGFYAQARTLTPGVALAATATGLFAAAVLAINNYRDATHDRASGRRTVAVIAGAAAARRLYGALVCVPSALVALLAYREGSAVFLLPLLTLPASIALVRRLGAAQDGTALTRLLLATVKAQLLFGVLLATAAFVAPAPR
jgi:1,4-dihydroxy-2-naphthoate octaprenyltransferase